ncbi:MAG: hypothetical protein [Caudoviricetes sp.]|nr:MAG: hypothetical protein [Caudoviricetes sp.]
MKTLQSADEYCDVWVWVPDEEGAICLQDETGEIVYMNKKQAAELLPILEHFIKTGELPE